jgi:integrase
VFPSHGESDTIERHALGHWINRHLEELEAQPFTPHDLRRTAASYMTSLGIPRLVVSKILNHAEYGVTAVYDRHSYDEDKRAALATWGQHLVTPSECVQAAEGP